MKYIVTYTKPATVEGTQFFYAPRNVDQDELLRSAHEAAGEDATIVAILPYEDEQRYDDAKHAEDEG